MYSDITGLSRLCRAMGKEASFAGYAYTWARAGFASWDYMPARAGFASRAHICWLMKQQMVQHGGACMEHATRWVTFSRTDVYIINMPVSPVLKRFKPLNLYSIKSCSQDYAKILTIEFLHYCLSIIPVSRLKEHSF